MNHSRIGKFIKMGLALAFTAGLALSPAMAKSNKTFNYVINPAGLQSLDGKVELVQEHTSGAPGPVMATSNDGAGSFWVNLPFDSYNAFKKPVYVLAVEVCHFESALDEAGIEQIMISKLEGATPEIEFMDSPVTPYSSIDPVCTQSPVEFPFMIEEGSNSINLLLNFADENGKFNFTAFHLILGFKSSDDVPSSVEPSIPSSLSPPSAPSEPSPSSGD